MATIKIEIPDDQAEALANLCKRIDFNTMCEPSDGEAAYRRSTAGCGRSGRPSPARVSKSDKTTFRRQAGKPERGVYIETLNSASAGRAA